MPKFGRSWVMLRAGVTRRRRERLVKRWPHSEKEEMEMSVEVSAALRALRPGTYRPFRLHRLLDQFPNFMVTRGGHEMVEKGLAEWTPNSRLKILPKEKR